MSTAKTSIGVLLSWMVLAGATPVFAKPPRALVEVIQQDSGIGTLRLRFVDIPEEFAVERIRLDLRQLSPVAPVPSENSTRVKAVPYDVLVPVASLDEASPVIEHKLDLLHDPAEPYALALLCLWLDRPDSQVTLAMRPHFIGPNGSELKITAEPEWVEVKLRNIAQVQALPAKGKGECKN